MEEIKKRRGRPPKAVKEESKDLLTEPAPTSSAAKDEFVDTVSAFETRIQIAKSEGAEWIETTPEIIKYHNPNGLGRAEYFIYRGIKVAPVGQAERLMEQENYPLRKKILGPETPVRD